jgi:anti-sigma factor RsiW
MTQSLREMMTCRWSARHIQRYLDADPAAPLAPAEVSRLEAHLAVCERCTQTAAEHRALHRALSRWSGRLPDPDAIERLRAYARRIPDRGGR